MVWIEIPLSVLVPSFHPSFHLCNHLPSHLIQSWKKSRKNSKCQKLIFFRRHDRGLTFQLCSHPILLYVTSQSDFCWKWKVTHRQQTTTTFIYFCWAKVKTQLFLPFFLFYTRPLPLSTWFYIDEYACLSVYGISGA